MSQYSLISADSHVVESPDLWKKWLQPEFLDRAPDGEPVDAELVGEPGLAGKLVARCVGAIRDRRRNGLTHALVQRDLSHGATVAVAGDRLLDP